MRFAFGRHPPGFSYAVFTLALCMRAVPLQLDLRRFPITDDRLGLESECAHGCGGLLDPLTDTACRVGIRPKDDPLAAEVAIECDVRTVDIHGELLSDA